MPPSDYITRKNAKREANRERIDRWVAIPIDNPRLLRDPLARTEIKSASTLTLLKLLIVAVAVHLIIISFFLLVNRLLGAPLGSDLSERVKVIIIEPPPPPPEPLPVEPVPEEEEPPPEVIEEPPPPDFPPEEPEAELPPQEEPEAAQPPPPPVAPSKPEPRRIVGLSLESTVLGGGGPAFATGTTRMGATERKAVDPQIAAQQPPTQRAASRIPTRDRDFVKPKRLNKEKPPYPPTLKAQGIEGNVLVRVDIDIEGRVTRVDILKGSGYPEFDEAARKAALADRFSPATRYDQPVPFTLSYSFRFRIEDE